MVKRVLIQLLTLWCIHLTETYLRNVSSIIQISEF